MQDLLNDIETLEDTSEKVDLLNKISYEYHQNNISKTKKYAEDALTLAEKIDYTKGITQAKINLGMGMYLSGEIHDAFDLYMEAYRLADQTKELPLLCKVTSNIAMYYHYINQVDLATQWYLKGIDYSDQCNSIFDKASIYNNLGSMFLLSNRRDKAKYYFEKCIELAETVPGLKLKGLGKINMLVVSLEEKDVIRIRELLGDIKAITDQTENKRLLAFYYMSLAGYYAIEKKLSLAIKASKNGVLVWKETGEEVQMCNAEYELAMLYNDNQDLDKAIFHGHKSLELALKNSSNASTLGGTLGLYHFLADVYDKKEEYKSASEFYQKALTLNKKQKIEEREKQALELERKYQAEKKELENALLKSEQKVSQAIINNQRIKNELLEKQIEVDKLVKKELTRSNEDLESFAHVASHDIKSPVIHICQFSQLLHRAADNKLNKEEKEYLSFIINSSEKLSVLIDDVLEYSKANSQKVKYSEVDMNILFFEIESIFSLELIAKNIKLNIQSDLPIISIDQIKIKRVFQNLIGNAIKFYDPNKEAKISIVFGTKDNSYLFSVIDNGMGVAETSKDIFQPFIYLNSQSEYTGTGMGLALCKRIIDQHKGSISYESTVGQGSTFYIELPKIEGLL